MFNREELEYLRVALQQYTASTKRALNAANLRPHFKVMHEKDLQLIYTLSAKVHELINNPQPKK